MPNRPILTTILSLGLSACYSLPSVDEKAAARRAEGFDPDYRLAVTVMQREVQIESQSPGAGVIPALFRELDESIAQAQVSITGGAPLVRLDSLARDAAEQALGVRATILDRASYGATNSLLGSDDSVTVRSAWEAAGRRGDDGLLAVVVTPEAAPRGFGATGGFHLSLSTRLVLRSVRHDRLLLMQVEPVVCHEPVRDASGQFRQRDTLSATEIPQALLDCYENVVVIVPQWIEAALRPR